MADGTTFDIDLSVTGGEDAAALANEAMNLANKLDTAKLAVTQAAAAVNASQAAYRAAEAAAGSASVALEKMNLKVDDQRAKVAKLAESQGGVDSPAYQRASAKLAELTSRQTEVAQAAAKAKAAMDGEAATLDRLKGASASASAAQDSVAKALEKAKTLAANAQKAQVAAAGSGKANEIAEGLGKLGGPLGAVGQKVFGVAEGFKKMSASLGSAGPYVAVAVGLLAIVAGAVAAAVAVAGVTAAILKFAITNADAARTEKLLAEQAKGGEAGLAATKALTLSLDAQAKKLTASLSKIFSVSAPKLESLLNGLSKLVALFDENSVTANALKVVFQSLFDPLVDGIVAFIPKAVSAFIQFEILVLKAMIAIKPFGSTILEIGKWVGIVALVIGGALALAVGVVAAGVAAMAIGFAVLVVAITAVVAGAVWLAMALNDLGASAVDGIVGAFTAVREALSSFSLAELGAQMMAGLVNGITGGAQAVVSAITGSVQGAIDSAKSLLGIASPSKVFAEIGGFTAEGMAGGVDDGSGDVQQSLEAMVAPPDAKAGAAPGGGANGGGIVVNLTVNAEGNADPHELSTVIYQEILRTLEMWAVQSGHGRADKPRTA